MYGAKTRVPWTQGDHTSKAFYNGPKTLLPALRKPSAHIGATSYATSWGLPLLKCYRKVCKLLSGTVSSDSKKLKRLSYLAHMGQQLNCNMFVVFVVCVCLLKFKTTAQSSRCMCVRVHVSQFTSNLQHKVKNQIIITHRGCSVFVCCIVSFNFQWLRTLFHRWTYIIFFFFLNCYKNK